MNDALQQLLSIYLWIQVTGVLLMTFVVLIVLIHAIVDHYSNY